MLILFSPGSSESPYASGNPRADLESESSAPQGVPLREEPHDEPVAHSEPQPTTGHVPTYPGYGGWIFGQGNVATPSEAESEPLRQTEPTSDTALNQYSHGTLTADDGFGRILGTPSAPEFDSRAVNGHDFLNRETAERHPIAGRVGSYQDYGTTIDGVTRWPPFSYGAGDSQGDIRRDNSESGTNTYDDDEENATPYGSSLASRDVSSRSAPLAGGVRISSSEWATSPSDLIARCVRTIFVVGRRDAVDWEIIRHVRSL